MFTNMRAKVVPMKVKEAIIKLRNKNKTVWDISQILGLAKSTVWNLIKKRALVTLLIAKELAGQERPPQKNSLHNNEKSPNTCLTVNTLQESVWIWMATVHRGLHMNSEATLQDANHCLATKNRMTRLPRSIKSNHSSMKRSCGQRRRRLTYEPSSDY